MTDTVIAAWITVGGMAFVAVASVLSQFCITRFVIRNEQNKIAQQVNAEHRSRVLEVRRERLAGALADLLAESDPQVNVKLDYGRVVRLIHLAQLALDRTQDSEAAVCSAINRLGLELQKYIPHHTKPVQARLGELNELLAAHAAVADLGGQILHRPVEFD